MFLRNKSRLNRQHARFPPSIELQPSHTQILGNLDSGSAPDGSPMKLSVQSRQEGTRIWTSRRLRVQYAIANALCQIKDYDSGLKLYEEIVKAEEDVKRKKAVLTGVGRLMLQVSAW